MSCQYTVPYRAKQGSSFCLRDEDGLQRSDDHGQGKSKPPNGTRNVCAFRNDDVKSFRGDFSHQKAIVGGQCSVKGHSNPDRSKVVRRLLTTLAAGRKGGRAVQAATMELIRKKMKPYQPSEQLVVRDSVSLSMDEDLSDDVEDEVFIRDGRTCRTYEDRGAKRPLMAPRRKYGKATSGNGSAGGSGAGGVRSSSPILKKYRRRKCWKCCEPFCYGLAAVTVLIGLIVLAALLLTAFPQPLQKIKIWFHKESAFSSAVIRDKFSSLMYTANGVPYDGAGGTNGTLEIVPCTQITVQNVWTRVIARVNSESPLRKLDANGDGVDDVIVGYGIDEMIDEGIRGYIPQCTSRKTGITDLCGGGLLALNGINGETLWQRWTSFTIFSLKCNIDINSDGGNDCVAAGRGGLILAIDGHNGRILWELKDYSDLESYAEISIDLYTINVVRDLNNDAIADIIAVHVEETQRAHGGHIKLISGATGAILRSIPTPYREEMFVPIQVLTRPDGADMFLVVTGGQNSPGGIYVLKQQNLMKYPGESAFEPIVRMESSGFMVPAVLSDLNGDGIEDIVVSSFNSTVYAFDGANRTQLWSFTIADSESVSSIVPGRFDHDNVTDFMVKYNTGPGFPIYYYSQTMIINGTNGKPFLDVSIKDAGGPNGLLGGITISQTGGGDFFLHWQMQCRNHTADTTDEYQFIPESDVIQQSRADTCALRYNQSSMLKLYAITRHVEPPGAVIFSSDDLTIRLNETGTADQQQQTFVAPMKHPKMKLRGRNDGHSSATMRKSSSIEAPAVGQAPNAAADVHMDKKLSPSQRTSDHPVGVVVESPGQAAQLGAARRKDIFRAQQPAAEQSIDTLAAEEEAKRQEKMALNNVYKKYIYNANDDETDGVELAGAPGMGEGVRGDERKPYIYLPYDQMEQEAPNPFLTNQIPPVPGAGGLDYDYGAPPPLEDDGRPIPSPYKRPRYRSSGRDVRSKFGVFDDIDLHDRSLEEQVLNESNPNSQIVKKVLLNDEIMDDLKNADPGSKGSKETLWDLEMEKEAKEAMNDVNAMNYEYNNKARRQTATTGSTVNSITTVGTTVSSTSQPTTSSSIKQPTALPNENILPSIASTGVLLKSVGGSGTGTAAPPTTTTTGSPTIDYVFVMNIRESERYPPLFLDTDLSCIQEKLQAYRTYRNEDMLQLEKKFFAQCLKARLPDLTPQYQRFETQIIITRVEIGCACSADLNPAREVCSKLHTYDQQRWTQYMGNEGNGRY
uniref:FAM234A/B beta-propeller domain-containing protein n=1 Tax=Anopheles farauti TaxID=69004 RepID=A0A182QQ69_9DIPT